MSKKLNDLIEAVQTVLERVRGKVNPRPKPKPTPTPVPVTQPRGVVDRDGTPLLDKRGRSLVLSKTGGSK